MLAYKVNNFQYLSLCTGDGLMFDFRNRYDNDRLLNVYVYIVSNQLYGRHIPALSLPTRTKRLM